MSRKIVILTLLFLSIGFASINTTLYVEGMSNVAFNTEDFNVYFSAVYVDDEDHSNEVLNEEKNVITYRASELKNAGTSVNLTYDIANESRQYDAVIQVSCSSSLMEVRIPSTSESIIINSKEVKTRGITLSLTETITEEAVITCAIDAIPSERVTKNENELTIVDTYVLYGNYIDSTNIKISNANLVIYSDTPHYVTTDENGYLFYNGLEQGAHEIYYIDDTLENIKNMTKDEVMMNAISKAEFTTTSTGEILFLNSSKITNQGIMKTQSFCKTQLGNSVEFDYIGESQVFETLCNGIYKIELWGAQGGDVSTFNGGLGAYTSGDIELLDNTKLNIYVGNAGNNIREEVIYNNGSTTADYEGTYNIWGATGGGATDIRLVGGNWSEFESLKSRIMVAAAGGGAGNRGEGYGDGNGGAGGGLIGYSGETVNFYRTDNWYEYHTYGGTQVDSGYVTHGETVYKNGGFGRIIVSETFAVTGGSGYYTGSGRQHSGGSGGSSFISGHTGCDAITEESTETNIIHTGQANHYSGYVFTNTQMIDGAGYRWTTEKGSEVVGMPTHDGTSTMIGNEGNGYAKITLISLK